MESRYIHEGGYPPGEEFGAVLPERRLEVFPGADGIIDVTNMYGHKYQLLDKMLRAVGFKGEHHAVSPVAEELNIYTSRPELIAITKLMQAIVENNGRVQSAQEAGESLVFAANDVLVGQFLNGNWEEYNKLDADLSKDEIFSVLKERLGIETHDGAVNYRQLRVRTGIAALALFPDGTIRGGVGVEKHRLILEGMPDYALALYVFGLEGALERGFDQAQDLYDVLAKEIDTSTTDGEEELVMLWHGVPEKLLKNVNGGMLLEHKVIDKYIVEADNVVKDNPGYSAAKERVMEGAWGAAGAMIKVLQELNDFAFKRNIGDYTSYIGQDLKLLFNRDLGNWFQTKIEDYGRELHGAYLMH